ncbi:hypothetical protein AB0G73_33880 [Streptomyces sp. NPDC020719]|uniref:hypothetical protein n=1 Tax=unclassified Streptomyces TaxID=2593676 RepID=UPI0033FB433D
MDGMHYSYDNVHNNDPQTLTISYHYEQPALDTIAQLSLSSVSQNAAERADSTIASFTKVRFVDSDGQTRELNPGFVNALSRSKLVGIEWQVQLSNVAAFWLLNLFYWPSVS